MRGFGGGKFSTKRATINTLGLALGIWLMLGGTAAAVQCSNNTPAAWLPAGITTPAPADRQAIMDLIHSYLWSLDERNITNFDASFSDNATYETCRGGGAVQIVTLVDKKTLVPYIDNQFEELAADGLQTRHIESNTLLHSKGSDTVDGKTALLVSIDRAAESPTPELDYTAVVLWTFHKDGETWKIAKLILITDSPEAEERAR
jgi:hypothetical protein